MTSRPVYVVVAILVLVGAVWYGSVVGSPSGHVPGPAATPTPAATR